MNHFTRSDLRDFLKCHLENVDGCFSPSIGYVLVDVNSSQSAFANGPSGDLPIAITQQLRRGSYPSNR